MIYHKITIGPLVGPSITNVLMRNEVWNEWLCDVNHWMNVNCIYLPATNIHESILSMGLFIENVCVCVCAYVLWWLRTKTNHLCKSEYQLYENIALIVTVTVDGIRTFSLSSSPIYYRTTEWVNNDVFQSQNAAAYEIKRKFQWHFCHTLDTLPLFFIRKVYYLTR